MIQRHMERLRATPRQNEVDPNALRWTPSSSLSAVLSEEEREAEMDVCFLSKSADTSYLVTQACSAVIECLFD